VIHLSAINKSISEAEAKELPSFYLEVLVKPGYRSKKPKALQPSAGEDSAGQDQDRDE